MPKKIIDPYKLQVESEEHFMEILATLAPELYLIQQSLLTTNLNPMIIPRIIRSIANIGYGTKFGDIVIKVENGRVKYINGVESDLINLGLFSLRKEEK